MLRNQTFNPKQVTVIINNTGVSFSAMTELYCYNVVGLLRRKTTKILNPYSEIIHSTQSRSDSL